MVSEMEQLVSVPCCSMAGLGQMLSLFGACQQHCCLLNHQSRIMCTELCIRSSLTDQDLARAAATIVAPRQHFLGLCTSCHVVCCPWEAGAVMLQASCRNRSRRAGAVCT